MSNHADHTQKLWKQLHSMAAALSSMNDDINFSLKDIYYNLRMFLVHVFCQHSQSSSLWSLNRIPISHQMLYCSLMSCSQSFIRNPSTHNLFPLYLAFLDLSHQIYAIQVHTAGYIRERNEKGHNKEDWSYTQMHYDFILKNVYFNFVNIFHSFCLNHTLLTPLKTFVPSFLNYSNSGATKCFCLNQI